MSMFGKQYHYCSVCGKLMYDDRLSTRHPSLCDTKECRDEYEIRYARAILGRDAEEKDLSE